jgi:hypothetical protein
MRWHFSENSYMKWTLLILNEWDDGVAATAVDGVATTAVDGVAATAVVFLAAQFRILVLTAARHLPTTSILTTHLSGYERLQVIDKLTSESCQERKQRNTPFVINKLYRIL